MFHTVGIFVFIVIILFMLPCILRTYEGMEGTVPDTVKGIKQSDISPGKEDLYILKSQVVPPVCPKCPSVVNVNRCKDSKDPPPCPPCGRCPEPAFECKKVPIYSRFNNPIVRPFIDNPPMK